MPLEVIAVGDFKGGVSQLLYVKDSSSAFSAFSKQLQGINFIRRVLKHNHLCLSQITTLLIILTSPNYI